MHSELVSFLIPLCILHIHLIDEYLILFCFIMFFFNFGMKNSFLNNILCFGTAIANSLPNSLGSASISLSIAVKIFSVWSPARSSSLLDSIKTIRVSTLFLLVWLCWYQQRNEMVDLSKINRRKTPWDMLLHINIKKVYYFNLRAMGYFIIFILNFCFKTSVIESWIEPKVFNSFRKKAQSQMFDRVSKCSSEYHIINRDVFIS